MINSLKADLRKIANPEKAKILQRFLKLEKVIMAKGICF